MWRRRRSIASRRARLMIDGIDLPERIPEATDTAAWQYPACDRRPA